MACFLMSVSLGNLFVSGVNFFIQEEGPHFRPDVQGTYQVELSVSDGNATATQRINVTVQKAQESSQQKEPASTGPKETPPSANAGQDVAVKPNKAVRMYATGDRGDARGKVVYHWAFISFPESSKLTIQDLQDAKTRNPVFVPDTIGTYELEFTFQVGNKKATDRVSVLATTKNTVPIATSDDITWSLDQKGPVKLDGSGSFDPDGDPLEARWTLGGKPADSKLKTSDINHSDRLQPGSKLSGASYYLFFAFCMLATAILFIPVAMRYRVKSYIVGRDENPSISEES